MAARLHDIWPDAVVMSAIRPVDVARLRERIVDFFDKEAVEAELRVGYDRQALRGEIFASCTVLGEQYDERGVVLRVRADAATIARLQGLLQT